MLSRLVVLTSLFWCVAASGAEEAGPGSSSPQYLLEFKLFTVPEAVAPAQTGRLTAAQLEAITVHPEAVLLSAPKLLVAAGTDAEIMVGPGSTEYFERDDGGYALRRLDRDQSPGLRVKARVEEVDSMADRVRLECNARVTILQQRLPVEGVQELDVGMPVISQREVITTAIVPLGEWNHLGGISTRNEDRGRLETFVWLVRIEGVRPDGSLAAAPGSPLPFFDGDIRLTRGTITQAMAEGSVTVGEGAVLLMGTIEVRADTVQVERGPEGDRLSLSARRIEHDAASGRLILIGEVEIGGQGARIVADRVEILVPPNGAP